MRRAIGGGLLALFLAACGGGGDSAEPPISSALRLANVSAQNTQQQVQSGAAPVGDVTVMADVTGDLTRLNGQVVYVIVEDPDHLFNATPVVMLGAGGLGNRIVLQGLPTTGRAGSFHGPLRVFVCLDSACTKALGNSPLSVPYQIDIVAG